MKFTLFFLRMYYRVLSAIWPARAGKKAFLLFQTVRNRTFRDREFPFYKAANRFTAPWDKEDITCYELGDPKGKTVVLVHGWDSNAGSMSAIGFELARRGYHVVAFDLPAHGYSKLKRTHLRESAEALQAVIQRIHADEPVSIVSHSFGSGVSSFALSRFDIKVDKLVYLTSPNRLADVFGEFKSLIKLGDKAFAKVVKMANTVLGEPVLNVSVATSSRNIRFNDFLILHDRQDRIIPFQRSAAIHMAVPESELIELEGTGHYRMLWDEKVIDLVMSRFPEKEVAGRKERVR